MKIGLGLSRHQLDLEHYRFARQCGCTHLALHLTPEVHRPRGHFHEAAPAGGYPAPAAAAGAEDFWTYESLARLTEEINSADLQVASVDHPGPIFPSDRRLEGAGKRRWLDRFKAIIRHVGSVGIPLLGYDAAAPETDRRVRGRLARGDAETSGIHPSPRQGGGGKPPAVPSRGRWKEFLKELLPVAEDAGVTLTARVRHPDSYREISDLHASTRHALEFDLTEAAASFGDGVYAALDTCLREKRIASLRLGNIRSGPPRPHESFVDEGDIDILRIVLLLKFRGYDGLILPRDAPQMHCAAPWHAGMAHTLGYLKAALQACGAA